MKTKIVRRRIGYRLSFAATFAAIAFHLQIGSGRAAECSSNTPVLHLAIATHSEDQPDYSSSKLLYANARTALISFAQLMAARGLA